MRGLMAGLASLSTLTVPTAALAQDVCSVIRALTSPSFYQARQVEVRSHYGNTQQLYVGQSASLPRDANTCALDVYAEEDWIGVDLECEWAFEEQHQALRFLDELARDVGPCLPAPMQRDDEEIDPDMAPVAVGYHIEQQTGDDGGELFVELYFWREANLEAESYNVYLTLTR